MEYTLKTWMAVRVVISAFDAAGNRVQEEVFATARQHQSSVLW